MVYFFDLEVDKKKKTILDYAIINENGSYLHSKDLKRFKKFMSKADYYAGHNIINHDVPIVEGSKNGYKFDKKKCIDTLFLSVLLFPEKPYHKLIKDDKLIPEDSNNPLNDSKNSQLLFEDEVNQFRNLDNETKAIYYSLLKDMDGFSGFFDYLEYKNSAVNVVQVIKDKFLGKICESANIFDFINDYPVELAYSLALISTTQIQSKFPTWIIKNHPMVEKIMLDLRSTPCEENCNYCSVELDSVTGLQNFFTYDAFRLFEGEPLQKMAVDSALQNKSLIVVFPTGGGKSITYQLPAFISGKNSRALTVVISPLQSLMKDQVDNLEEKTLNMSGTINGLLDPIERSKVIERVLNGEISLLYISPESLRSKSIEKLLLSRDIARFVIDEAHCFSTWGHDFRVDYLYVGKFIKMLQEQKGNNKKIPVSCFTATAKKDVVDDIEEYFEKTLDLKMDKIISRSNRTNLRYKVINVTDDDIRYKETRRLIDQRECPTIIYASRTGGIDDLYTRLKVDGYSVSKFHGQMDKDDKVIEQNKFMSGETQVMVATSAFGMGVDKSDIGMVIHFEISSSIENYIQEAGRAGRDFSLEADCYILYKNTDLDKHFRLLSRTKLNHKEIQQIWQGIKKVTKTRKNVTKSALEIAKSAGWDESIRGMQTRVTTAIAALEDSGYLDRKQNSPRVFANSILVETQIEAVNKIDKSEIINKNDKELAKRITKSLISSKYTKRGTNDEAESRVDHLSDILGVEIKEVMRVLRLLRDEKILADVKDLRCTIRKNAKINTSKRTLESMNKLEQHLIESLNQQKSHYNLKELNEDAQSNGLSSNPEKIRLIINYLNISKQIIIKKRSRSNISLDFEHDYKTIIENSIRRFYVASLIVDYLFKKSFKKSGDVLDSGPDNEVVFSILELKNICNKGTGLLDKKVSSKEIEDSLYYLKKINALNIDGGFLVIYSPMNIERLQETSKRYLKKDYQKLEEFYKNKSQQIHIVGEYAKKVMENYNSALEFVNDYFVMDYNEFIKKYFNKRKDEINRNMSESKFQEIFSKLSIEQLAIVNDKENDSIVVAAGPGSGKTRLLVHKLAAIFYTEDIRHEQLLMLTFSRSAVNEFKERILKMIGSQAHYFEIKTFHSFCFDLLGRVGDLEKSQDIIKDAVQLIKDNEVEESRITKMVIVIDEAQDMKEEEYELIKLLLSRNENVKLIAVGDDDQNIYSFRGSSNVYLKDLASDSKLYELPTNYRAKRNLVEFSNRFVDSIEGRMKSIPIQSYSEDSGLIRVIKHIDTNLKTPVVKHILSAEFKGRTCVLTRSNTEANYVAGLLNKKGMKAQLIQENSKFVLFSLSEIRDFLEHVTAKGKVTVISHEQWSESMSYFFAEYNGTLNFDICLNALNTFDRSSGKIKYYSDLKEFMKVSLYDDYIKTDNIIVSTLHKSKGREFDNVVILYDYAVIDDNDEKRLLYVGMTRAKTNLFIHYKGDFLNFENIENCKHYEDNREYEEPEYIVFTLTHKDLNLGYFKFTHKNVINLNLGSSLTMEEKYKLSHQNRKILQFSKRYQSMYNDLIEQNYKLIDITARHKVLWYNSDEEEEYQIVLPQIAYKRIIEEDVIEDVLEAEINVQQLKESKYEKRRRFHDFISKNINEGVSITIRGHKMLPDGDYIVSSISDYYGGSHEGKNYFVVHVDFENRKHGIGCKCIIDVYYKNKRL